ncbi:MAG TPA: CerR family C-terminal domain-containing protein [Caulobacteraceae bacterium]
MDPTSQAPPRRRPAEGGYARGEETRGKIIEAAFLVFAEEGYVSASTRRIAAEAGVTPPALQYHFDSKEGLHRACGQAIADRIHEQLEPQLAEAHEALSQGDRQRRVDALYGVLARSAELAMAKSDTDRLTRFMNRCQADDVGPAFDVVQQEVGRPFAQVSTALLASVLGLDPGGTEARLRSAFILSQLSILHTNREGTLLALGWDDFGEEQQAVVRRILRDNIERLVAKAGAVDVADAGGFEAHQIQSELSDTAPSPSVEGD